MDFNAADEGIDKQKRWIQKCFFSAKQFSKAKKGFAKCSKKTHQFVSHLTDLVATSHLGAGGLVVRRWTCIQ